MIDMSCYGIIQVRETEMKEFMASIAETLPALKKILASTNFDQVQANINFYYGVLNFRLKLTITNPVIWLEPSI